ncbi:hypothetical protein FQR65_LT04622 [Abscondita terminalis]|nr:hypothetical protein FQR65_LT04622 [Abscondita terminalis]
MYLKILILLSLLQLRVSDTIFDNVNCGVTQSDSWLAVSPWLAAIKARNNISTLYYTKCAGVVINQKYVLTTATCLSPDPGTTIKIIQLGATYIQNFTARSSFSPIILESFYTAEKTIVHPEYDSKTRKNDIALIRLERPVKYEEFLQPICLPFHVIPQSDTFYTSTWRDYDELFKSFPTGKNEIGSSPASAWIYNKIIEMIEWENNTVKLCNGYIGAPLMFIKNNQYFLKGLLIKNVECNSKKAGVYLNVFEYMSWIEENVEPNHSECLTPDNQKSTCILLNNCPILLAAFANPKNAHSDYLSKYICSNDQIGGFQVCCPSSLNSTLQLNSDSSFDSLSEKKYCGLQQRDDYFSKDETISLDEYPWAASVQAVNQRGQEYSICSGSLINNRYVLTSAYCLFTASHIAFVRLGEYNLLNKSDCVEDTRNKDINCNQALDVGIEKFVIHPFYNPWSYNNDIALIKLKTNVCFTDYIRPICLPTLIFQSMQKNDTLYATSFSPPQPWGNYNLKKKLAYELVENKMCQYKHTMSEYQMCINSIPKSTDPTELTCLTDDGAPITRVHKHRWFLEGIITERVSYCGITEPIVVTKVKLYLPWLEENMNVSMNFYTIFDNANCGVTQSNSWAAISPWLAAIKVRDDKSRLYYTKCAGVLINHKYVLTTATCLSPDPGTTIKFIQLGVTNVLNFTERTSLNYDSKTRENDIALVRLERLVKYEQFLQPICLPFDNTPESDTFYTSSWDNYDELFKSFPTGKHEIGSSSTSAWNKKKLIETIEWANNSLKLCDGYIGAPLMFIKSSQYYLQGLLLKNVECNSKQAAVYLNIVEYIGWIKENVAPNDNECLTPDNQKSTCILLNNCPILLAAFGNPKNAHLEYLSKYICSNDEIGGFQVCCPSSVNSTLLFDPVTNFNSLSNKKFCGFQHRDDYFSEDETISLDEYPWAASIRGVNHRGEEYSICSGSLINNRYVLTSAYCLFTSSRITFVRLGEYNLLNKSDCVELAGIDGRDCVESKDVEIEQFIVHPFYNVWSYNNDIALIKLKTDVLFTDYIRPICLPTSNFQTAKISDTLYATSFSPPKVWGSYVLKKKLAYELVDNKMCQYKHTMSEYQMCVNSIPKKSDPTELTCFSDDGAPIMSSRKNQWVLEGITTERVSYCAIIEPVVVTKVKSYLPWIQENMVLKN